MFVELLWLAISCDGCNHHPRKACGSSIPSHCTDRDFICYTCPRTVCMMMLPLRMWWIDGLTLQAWDLRTEARCGHAELGRSSGQGQHPERRTPQLWPLAGRGCLACLTKDRSACLLDQDCRLARGGLARRNTPSLCCCSFTLHLSERASGGHHSTQAMSMALCPAGKTPLVQWDMACSLVKIHGAARSRKMRDGSCPPTLVYSSLLYRSVSTDCSMGVSWIWHGGLRTAVRGCPCRIWFHSIRQTRTLCAPCCAVFLPRGVSLSASDRFWNGLQSTLVLFLLVFLNIALFFG
jgi:hypothetical protein